MTAEEWCRDVDRWLDRRRRWSWSHKTAHFYKNGLEKTIIIDILQKRFIMRVLDTIVFLSRSDDDISEESMHALRPETVSTEKPVNLTIYPTYLRKIEIMHWIKPPALIDILKRCQLLVKLIVCIGGDPGRNETDEIINHPSIRTVSIINDSSFAWNARKILMCKRITKLSLRNTGSYPFALCLPKGISHIKKFVAINSGVDGDIGQFIIDNTELKHLTIRPLRWKKILGAVRASKSLRTLSCGLDREKKCPAIVLDSVWRTGIRVSTCDPCMELMSRNNAVIYHKRLPTYVFSARLCDATVFLF